MNAKHSFARGHTDFVSSHAAWMVGAIVLVTFLAFPYARQLSLKANFIDLLPKDMPSVIHLNELTNQVGGTSFLVVAIESPNEKTAAEAAERFTQKAAAFKGIDNVDDRTNITAFQDRKLLFLNLESVQKLNTMVRDLLGYYRRKNNPFFIDLLDEDPPEIDIQTLELEEKVYRIGGFSGNEQETFMRVILLKPIHPVSDFERSERLFREAQAAFDEIQKDFEQPLTQ